MHIDLKNVYFKEELVRFLIDDWQSTEMVPFIGNKTVFVNYESCFKFQVIDQKIIRSEIVELSCPEHEEADTKMIYHVCKIEDAANVTIRCSDTDVLIIILSNMMFVKTRVKISMHVGTGNKQRFINVNELHQHLGNSLCLALPVFHALTGCDFNPCFFRKGKSRPFSILQRSEKYTEAFANLHVNNLDATIINVIEEYICQIYGFKKITNINQARLATFSKIYDFNENKNVLDLKIKKYDGSMLPPCKAELNEQIKRAAYIGTLWRNAHQRNLENFAYRRFWLANNR